MELTRFSVQKYRSIYKAEKLPLSRTGMTILVGPNNEGKSNIVQALTIGLRLLRRFHMSTPSGRPSELKIRVPKNLYDWDRDYPKHLQETQPSGTTILDFEFNLSTQERGEFHRAIGVNLKTTLPIRLSVGPKLMELSVRKQGRGTATLNARQARIARFVGAKIRVEHVQSVRTVDAAMDVVQEMLENELLQVSENPQYLKALDAIESAQRPVLDNLQDTFLATLQNFLPDVSSVKVDIPRAEVERALAGACRVIVDDGTPTELQFKGDGVKSLAAIALLRKAAEQYATRGELVLAIEEPEAHLHPSAIHGVRRVLHEIAAKQQLVISTHSPLFVNRADLGSNIVVSKNRAFPAKSITQLREALGVRTSDNLSSAEIVLVVEGSSDVRALSSYIAATSARCKQALATGLLAVESLGGAGNCLAKLTHLSQLMCRYHVLLDYDDAGRRAMARVRTEGLIEPADEQFVMVPGRGDSELEDVYLVDCYAPAIWNRWGVDVNTASFSKGKETWSSRAEKAFRSAGKEWDDEVRRAVKADVAARIEDDPLNGFHPKRRSAIDALVKALEAKIA